VTLGLEQARSGNPCLGYQLHACRGACVGKEDRSFHSARLMAALSAIRLRAWPFAGPALLREGEKGHVIDHWRYLGTIGEDGEVAALLEQGRGAFDADVYKILVKQVQRMQPLSGG
jgi:DNA polymerase III subunit epsilon